MILFKKLLLKINLKSKNPLCNNKTSKKNNNNNSSMKKRMTMMKDGRSKKTLQSMK